jgi:hypothetical protein
MNDQLRSPSSSLGGKETNVGSRRILLKNSLSAMFDFLGGRWARHSKNQLGDQPICRLGSVRGPQPV